ncbi:MAG: hypothetical protein ACPG57_02215, partial [Porticoccaceae bacterium]
MATIFQTTVSIILVSWVVLCGSGQAIAAENLDIQTEMKIYPGDQWALTTAENVGLRSEDIDQLFDLSFQDPATQGVALFKHGQLVDERYADEFSQDSLATSWSMAKSFYAALIGISIARGEIASLDDKVSQ